MEDQKKKIKFTLSLEQMAFYNQNIELIVEPGRFNVFIGSSSEDIRLKGHFKAIGDKKAIPSRRVFFSEVTVT